MERDAGEPGWRGQQVFVPTKALVGLRRASLVHRVMAGSTTQSDSAHASIPQALIVHSLGIPRLRDPPRDFHDGGLATISIL